MAVDIVDQCNGVNFGSTNECPLGGPATGGTVPVITNGTPPTTGVGGTVYTYTFTATGTGPISFSHTGDTIPNEVIDAQTGVYTILSSPSTGTFNKTIYAQNPYGLSEPFEFTVTFTAALVNPTITSGATIGDAAIGQTPVASNFCGITVTGTEPFTLALTAGAAPSGSILRTGELTAAQLAEGIFYGIPDTAGAGTSFTLEVSGPVGTTPTTQVYASGITVYQFAAISTTELADLQSNTAVTSAHNLTATGYPVPTNIDVAGEPSGIAWSGTGTASGAGVGFADAGVHTLTITCSNTCGSFGVKSFSVDIDLRVYVKIPDNTVVAYDPTQGKTFSSGSVVGTWAPVSGTGDLTPAGYDAAFSVSGSTGLVYDSTNEGLEHTTGSVRIGNNSFSIAVPHHIAFGFYAPTAETSGTAKPLVADNGFSPSCQYVDNGTSLHYFRYAAGGIAITSNTAGVTRGAWNYVQGWTASATSIGLRLNQDSEVTSTGASGATSILRVGVGHSNSPDNWKIGRLWIGNAVTDRDWVYAWISDDYTATEVPNPGPQTASIIYPASSSTMQGGAFKIKVDRGTVPQTGTTGCEIYENGTLVYTYPGDGGADGLDWDTYIHHAAPGSRTYHAIIKNTASGNVTTANVTNVTVPAFTNGTYSGAIFMQHMHQSGGATGRLRIALPDNPYDAVVTNAKIAGVIMNIEWKDYETALGVYTMNNILTNCAWCAARGKGLGICIFHVSYWGGTSDTSSVPVYIRDGSTSTYGAGYTGAGNVLNGKAGVSGRSAGGSTPHYWNVNVMNRWKAWIDYLASQLMPNGVPVPGFYCIDMNESTWAVQSNNNTNASLINAYGGGQGYGFGNQLIYYDMLKYVRSKFPGIPVLPGYNGPDAAGSTTVMYGAMDRARNDGFPWTGVRDSIMSKTAPFQNYGQWSEPLATAYDAYWPPTERLAIAHVEASAPIGPSGDQTLDHWEDLANQMPEKYGWRLISWALTNNSTYPSTNWTSTAAWTASQYLRDRTTVPDWVTNP